MYIDESIKKSKCDHVDLDATIDDVLHVDPIVPKVATPEEKTTEEQSKKDRVDELIITCPILKETTL